MTERRTKRRYAHEMYPHAEEGETRPLAVEVPHLYARAVGFGLQGTSWSKVEPARMGGDRVMMFIEVSRLALVADALHQGLTGDAAWEWADQRAWDESASCLYERAMHHGVNLDAIKPYPCGPEPERHDHIGDPAPGGGHFITRVDGKESECEECTEPVPADA